MTESDWGEQLTEQLYEATRAGAVWFLLSPFRVENLEAGRYLVDVVIAHKLRSDTVGHTDAGPVVQAVTGLVRADGGPLGRTVTLDLESLAVDAVLAHVRAGFVYVEVVPGDYRAGPGWDAVSAVVSSAVGHYRRFRWTAEARAFLLEHWPEHNASELGAILGVPPVRVRAQLEALRKRYGEDRVPFGQTGRPRKGRT